MKSNEKFTQRAESASPDGGAESRAVQILCRERKNNPVPAAELLLSGAKPPLVLQAELCGGEIRLKKTSPDYLT